MAKQTKTTERTAPLEGETLPPQQNAVATTTPAIDSFMKTLLPPKTARDISMSLPEHISFDLFKRNLWNAIAQNWSLKDYSPALLVREVSKAAALGLLLDPLLGEAYLIVGYNGKTQAKEPQLRVGYKGLMKLARQSGNVAGMWCHEVHEHDEVFADLGYPKRYSHKPVLFGERGPIIGYTAVIAYKDDSFDFEPMSLKQCLEIRDRSDAWKAFEKGLIKSTPWKTDESEMCKKTVFNRLMKRQDKSPEMRRAIEIENEAEFPHMIEHERQEPRRAPPPPPPPDDGGTPPSETGARDRSAERVKSTPRGERTAPKPTAEPAAEKPKLPMSTKELLAWIEQKYSEITPEILEERPDILGDLWEVEIAPRLDGLFPVDVDAAQSIRREHEKRLAP